MTIVSTVGYGILRCNSQCPATGLYIRPAAVYLFSICA